MRASMIAMTALLASCGSGGGETDRQPNAVVGTTSADEAQAIEQAGEMLENAQAVPGTPEETTPPEPKVDIYPNAADAER